MSRRSESSSPAQSLRRKNIKKLHGFKPAGYRLLAVVLLLTIVTSFMISCGSDSKETASNKVEVPSAQTKASQPAFEPIQFAAYDMDGSLRDSKEWIGQRPVVLNFWGTWCPPCRREIPDLIKLYSEYSLKGVEMIGLAVRDQPGQVKVFSEKAGMKWVMLMAEQNAMIDYNVTTGIPTTIFLDRTGREVARFIGPRNYDIFKQAFEAILAKPATS